MQYESDQRSLENHQKDKDELARFKYGDFLDQTLQAFSSFEAMTATEDTYDAIVQAITKSVALYKSKMQGFDSALASCSQNYASMLRQRRQEVEAKIAKVTNIYGVEYAPPTNDAAKVFGA